jgi:DNA polymerase I-like protein with 3'-5' exonuclease and polymerase domains
MKYPILFVGTQQQIEHWMHERLLARIGMKVDEFHYHAVEDGEEKYVKKLEGMKVICPLGEEGLWATLMEKEPLRWVMRTVRQPSRNLLICPVFAPSRLLPYRKKKTEEEDGEKVKFSGMERPARFQGVQQLAIRRAIEFCKNPPPAQVRKNYLQDPHPSAFKLWVNNALELGTQLSFDIETPYKIKQDDESETGENELHQREDTKNIIRISFSYAADSAVSIPWDARYMADIGRLLASDLEKIVWNGRTFDIPLIRANGLVVNGAVLDGMDMWHYYQSDLPKGLEFVSAFFTDLMPWKHINNSDPALYSCIDADAAYLIVQGITAEMTRTGQIDKWRVHDQQCMAQLDVAGGNGMHIHLERQKELETELTEMLREKLVEVQQDLNPAWMKTKVYVRLGQADPAFEWKPTVASKAVKRCAYCNKENVNKKHPCFKEQEQKILLDAKEVEAYYKTLTPDAPLESIQEWLKSNGFNPNSSNQLISYMKGNKHPVAKNWKTDADMADSKHLARLAVRYPDHKVYAQTVEIHKIAKALSTYILATDENGKAYCTYVNSPSTWRLGARNVNVQNQGKKEGNKYAAAARATIIAKPGYVFVQADSSAIEAVFVGVFMDDPAYIEIAKKSIHAYLCCKKLGWAFTKENVKRVKEEQEVLYNQLKRVVHGTNYGMGPYLMHMNEPEIFPTLRSAMQMQRFMFDSLPKLPEWQFDVRQRAKREGYLENPWGLKHYFYDVFNYAYDDDGELIIDRRTGRPKVKAGSDSKRVVAFLPQSSAGLFMRENIVSLGKELDPAWFPAHHSVHDSYCLEVPDHDGTIEYAAGCLREILTRRIPEMNNVRVGCEIEVGKDWKNMKRYMVDTTLETQW